MTDRDLLALDLEKPIHVVHAAASSNPAAIGVDIGGTNHTAALVDAEGHALEILRGHTDRSAGPAGLIASLQRLVPELLAEARERELDPVGIGVGFGGPVDFTAGRVLLSHHVEGWEGYPLRAHLEQIFALAVTLDNDANAGGLGEARFGAGYGARDVVYYNIGTGIGGAIILDGRLRRGPASLAGELGHVTIDPDGPVCTCGQQGCLEALSAGSAIARHMAAAAIPWEDRSAGPEEFFPLVTAGNRAALQIRDQIVEPLALGIRNVLHTLNPEVVVIGGGVSRGGELLLAPLRRRVQELAFPAAFASCEIRAAALGYDAGVIGAAALVLEHLPPR